MDPPQNFRGRNQQRRFEALSQRAISLTLYHDVPTMDSLGITDSVHYMFNQLGWEKAHLKNRFITYREITLEVLSSLVYIPEHGVGARKGIITFRLFGIEFTYNHRDLAALLGFPSGPLAFTTPEADLLDFELDYFWGTLTGNYHPDPESMDNNEIHNPAIRYFHRILAHTLFGKEQNQNAVSKDELSLLYCMNLGRPVNAVPLLMKTFTRISEDPNVPVSVGGLVTMIAHALGPRYQLNNCAPFGSIRPMNIDFCFNNRIIGNLGPAPYDYLIRDEVVTLFTLPNHARISVHNRENWLYELNPPDHPSTPETPQSYFVANNFMSENETDPETPPGYHDFTNMAEAQAAPDTNQGEYTTQLNTILTTLDAYKTDIDGIKNELKTMRLDLIGLTDITVEQFYNITQALEILKEKIG